MIRALLGGSFDPVHAGHVAMVGHVLGVGLAEVVHVIPAWLSPHKQGAGAPAAERWAMAELAFGPAANVILDRREIRAGRPCRTVESLAALVAEYPHDTFRLVIGADNLPSFRTWAEPERLLELAELVVLGRAGFALDGATVRNAGLPTDRVHLEPDFDRPVSSTAVRAMLASGPRTAAAMVAGGIPAPVAAHIIDRHLYRPDRNGDHRVPDPD